MLKTLDELEEAAKQRSGLKIHIPACPPQLIEAEAEIMNTVKVLKSRNHIFGDLPTINDILDPPEEQEQEEVPYSSYQGHSDLVKVIADEVCHKIAVEKGEVILVESDDEDDAPASLSHLELISLCTQIQSSCLHHGDPHLAFELSETIGRYCMQLSREEMRKAKQMSIEDYLVTQ